MQTIGILGSTGSIGRQTLEVVQSHPDKLAIVAIAGRNVKALSDQARRFQVPIVAVADSQLDFAELRTAFTSTTQVIAGSHGLVEIAANPDITTIVIATTGRAGLEATLAAVRAGKRVAIANKEVLVMAGAIVMSEARKYGATILPIDSEHSALWQCMVGEEPSSVTGLYLTASGGALRDRNQSQLALVTPQEALQHPTWSMGPKVTIDSASLMNKGLEVIEAHWLFDVPYDAIHVLMHPTSTVHSLVSFVDGTIKAQLGVPDMRAPIQFALSYPERWSFPGQELSPFDLGSLSFVRPIDGRYPCLDLAQQAALQGGTYPAVLCGADEVAVDLFLSGRIRFTDIPQLIEEALAAHISSPDTELEGIVAADVWAREVTLKNAGRLEASEDK